MAEKNSVLVRTSRYVSGGTTEVRPNAIEWWERAVLPGSVDDRLYIVERRFNGRLDLIAALFLGEPRLWWVLAQYNSVLDTYAEITEGAILYIPSTTRVQSILNGKTGGVPSTREIPLTILPIV